MELGSRLRGNDVELGSRLRGNDGQVGSSLIGERRREHIQERGWKAKEVHASPQPKIATQILRKPRVAILG